MFSVLRSVLFRAERHYHRSALDAQSQVIYYEITRPISNTMTNIRRNRALPERSDRIMCPTFEGTINLGEISLLNAIDAISESPTGNFANRFTTFECAGHDEG
jgi:hypothetical protein